MNTRNFILAAAVLIGLPACDSDSKKTETTKTVTKTDTAKKVDVKTDVKTDTKTVAEKPATDTPPKEEPKKDPAEEKVQLAATVAREISGAPDKADEILAKHSLDRDKLDALMFEIAGDAELTKAYMAARRDT